jgi:hypothetical protein
MTIRSIGIMGLAAAIVVAARGDQFTEAWNAHEWDVK